MNILLIGGTGVLSSAVTIEAIRQGFDVTMINRGNRMNRVPQCVELIKADKNNHPFIESQLSGRKFDAVIDFLCYTRKDLEYSIDLYGPYTNQYFFISSCAVYKVSNKAVKYDEEAPKVDPLWSYSVDKYACEMRLIELARQKKVMYTIVRPSITYDDTRIPYGISPKYGYHWTLVSRVIAGKPIIRWNMGENYRNMMRVEDFAVGVVGLIGNEKAFNEAFNVCGDEAPTYNDVLNVISEYVGIPVKTLDISGETYAKELPARAGEILADRAVSAFFSNAKLKQAVPTFRQTIGYKEGIRMTLDAYKNRNFQRGIDWKFDGDSDRIINKYKNMANANGNIGYVDYLNNAKLSDKIIYWCARIQPVSISRLYLFTRNKLSFVIRIIRNLKYKLKKPRC